MAKKSYWRDAFAKGEVIQRVRPAESGEYMLNPHKGTTTFQRFNGDELYPGLMWNDREGPTEFKAFDGNLKNPQYPDTRMSYCRWLWKVIEPERGKFRWDIIDGALAAAEERNQTLQMRIQPHIGGDLPGWAWDAGITPTPDSCKGERVEPDSNSKAYIELWSEHIRAWGERYDGHPNFESFDVAFAGSCGETGGNATDETARVLIDVYLESFKKTQLLSMLGAFMYSYGMEHGLGWRADCIGDMRTDGRGDVPDNKNWNHMFDCYPMEVTAGGGLDAWKKAPVTLETCWTVGHWFKEGWDVDYILDQALKYHLSVFMPKSSYIPDELTGKIDWFNRKMGYRYVLRQLTLPLEAKGGQNIRMVAYIDNVGVAPIYRPYRFAYRFVQGKREEVVLSGQDIRKWLPDINWFREEIAFPAGFERGEVKVSVGIVDEKTMKPVVKLAIHEVDADNWHPMTSIDAL
ncbi:MAG: DUF4832 domain-containing protein [Planctomycetes bacterium]|nr:DUF4832 domain-containing protein [Planctomycetota bacterium]